MALASRGLRDMDGGPEEIEDDEERARVRARARGVHVRAILLAGALTAITLLLPT